ncbi:MAG: methionyl-tRNA formyltransferase [Erysipelotrichaceae bacterium]|nr:methionyl-tRNA formyltransferase [Erysipelotrichaceae bacterium]
MTRIVFMGTPDIACGILHQLIQDNYEIVGVVTQPDKKAGRKQELKESEVKQMARKHHIEVFQPMHIKEDYEQILDWKPDLIVTCAYGQFIPSHILDFPKFGSINVHASLLPELRGGAPIHWAVIQGHKKTGMTIMRMVKQMDAGAIMKQKEVEIAENDTMGDVYEKLKRCGAALIHESMKDILENNIECIEQNEAEATYAYNITKEQEHIDFTLNIQQVYDHIRGLIPFPIGYAMCDGKKIKFHRARMQRCAHSYAKGEICGYMNGGYAIAVEGGYIIIDEIQMEGKGKVDAKSFANGQGRSLIGKRFE